MEIGYGADRTAKIVRERIQQRWRVAYAPTRHLDVVLLTSAALLAVIGVVMVYSATYRSLQLQNLPTDSFAQRQAVAVATGLVAMFVAAAVDYRHFRGFAPVIYVAAVGLLAAVLTPLGKTVNGSRSWIDLGVTQLQPAELAKVALVVAIAAVLHERRGEPNLPTVAAVLGVVAIPALLILAQPDVGTLLVFPWTAFVLLLVGGARPRTLAALAAGAVGLAVAVVRLGLLEDYQVARLTAFLDPGNSELARTALYNTNQSMIAIGSGGLTGKGLLRGTQTNLSYVPENHTDFIFTVVGEEFGFLGAMAVLVLYGLIIWRGLRIAAMAKDLFGTLVATGAVAVFTIQLFINVGMTIGISPVTGIPLPFVSFGGTSLLSAFLLVGLMLNVHMRRF